MLLDSFSPRIVGRKIAIDFMCPVVGLYGFVNGFELHRTHFSYQRIGFLARFTELKDFKRRPHLFMGAGGHVEFDVALAVGGVWDYRTYERWSEFLNLLPRSMRVALIGSENGLDIAKELIDRYPSRVTSFVGMLSLVETCVKIAQSRIFVGADGGLWHIACALGKPNIVLFADCQLFDSDGKHVTRETEDTNSICLYHRSAVSHISPSDISEKVFQILPSCNTEVANSSVVHIDRIFN